MNKISIATFQGDSRACEVYGLWQYDYGQVLRIQDLGLPPAVEVHFSLSEKGGSSITRVGTTRDGVTDVVIPDSMLEKDDVSQDYWIYAYIYLTDKTSGSTEYKIAMKVKSRPRPEAIDSPEDQELFREAIAAVNDAADRAETAEKNAKNSEEESGKNAQRAKESAEAAEKTKKDALKEITQEKEDAVTAIDQKERDSVTNITQHTNSEIQRVDDHISESESGLEQTIKDAMEKKKALDGSIAESETAKTNLDSSVEIGKKQDATLNQTIETSSTSKAALDSSILAADSKNTDLSNTVESATTVDTSLKDQIKTGTQLKVDLVASGKQAVQDIQETTNKCLESIPEDYTELTSKVSTNENRIRTKAPAIVRSVTCESGAPVQITGSANAPLQGMRLYGRSEQKSTSGKNLFDAELLNAASNFNADLSPQGFWRIIIPVDNKDITISIKTTAKNAGYLMVNVDGSTGGKWMAHGSVTNLNRTVTLTPTSGVLYLNFSNNLETIKKTYEAVGYIQVEYGTEATDYEPYTGGLSSPSPEYPQEIESAGGDGEIGVSVTGKNLWIHGDCSSDRYVEKEVNLQPGVYVISFDVESEGETENLIFGALTKDYGWATSYYIQEGKGVTQTFVVESGFKVGYLRVYSEDTSSGSIGKKVTIKNVMLNHGSEPETYEIGKLAASTIPTPNGLPGIPVPANTAGITYTDESGQAWIADEIDLERGKYVQRVWRKTLDGSEDESWSKYDRFDLSGWYYYTQGEWKHSYAVGYCNQYAIAINPQELGTGNKKVRIGALNDCIYFVKNEFYNKSLDDKGLANWKAHLAANPLVVMTYLDTPIETDLTEEQLQVYKSLQTFCPTSVISNDAGAQMEVEYAVDTETYINGLNNTADARMDALTEIIAENKKSDELTQRRVDALWKLNQGVTYEFQSDAEDGYQKDVPTGGRYVGLKQIGGKSLVWGQMIDSDIINFTVSEEFKAMFPDDYYPYSEPEVVHAGVETVESLGKNLFHITKESDCDKGYDNITKRTILPGEYVSGLASNNYYFGNLKSTVDLITHNVSFVYDGRSGYGVGIGISCVKKRTYSFRCKTNKGIVYAAFYNAKGTFLARVLISTYNTFSIPDYVEQVVIVFTNSSSANSGDTVWFSEIQIEEAGAQTAYSPYSKTTLAIPECIRNLDGYGWSAGSVYNYVDFEEKKFHKRVGCVDLGTLNWQYYNSATCPSMRAGLSGSINNTLNLLTASGYEPISNSSMHDIGKYGICYFANRICIRSENMGEDVDTFKTAVSGVLLYYELVTEEVTDISDLLAELDEDAFILPVETGGTLTFRNTLGDSYRIPVPNSEEYIVKLSEVASNE